MKFCKRITYTYKGINNIETTIDYIREDDVLTFHGKEFLSSWLNFIKNKPTFYIDKCKCYYYIDYAFAARQTDSFLNPTG